MLELLLHCTAIIDFKRVKKILFSNAYSDEVCAHDVHKIPKVLPRIITNSQIILVDSPFD